MLILRRTTLAMAAVLALISALCRGQTTMPGVPPFSSATVHQALGVNIHFTDPKPGELEMLGRGGFGWVRMDFAWERTETAPGIYDFAPYDRLMKRLDEQQIRALFILDYRSKFYDNNQSPNDEQGRAAFAKWAAAAVAHFKGRHVLWEIYNEPNIGFWKPKPNFDDYAKMAVAATRAIHAAQAEEMVIGPATSGVDLKFIETCLNAGLGPQWVAISVHPYRQSNPETAADSYGRLHALLSKHNVDDRPIICGEWGYSAGWKKFDADLEGRYDVRLCLNNLANNLPLTIVYDWHDDGTDPKEPEHHFGLVQNAYHGGAPDVYDPKPGYRAIKTMTTELGSLHFESRLDVGSKQDYILQFGDGTRHRLAAWTTGKPHALTLPPAWQKCIVDNFDGSKTGTELASDNALELSDTPQYISRR